MGGSHLIEFEGEEIQRLDCEQTLGRLRDLYKMMSDANNLRSLDNKPAKFNLNFLMADVLECVNLLSFNHLSKVIGIANAGKIWQDVKNEKK